MEVVKSSFYDSKIRIFTCPTDMDYLTYQAIGGSVCNDFLLILATKYPCAPVGEARTGYVGFVMLAYISPRSLKPLHDLAGAQSFLFSCQGTPEHEARLPTLLPRESAVRRPLELNCLFQAHFISLRSRQ